MEKIKQCHDCKCKEGEIHDFGCDNERCPFCGGQLISCGCCYKHLGYDYDLNKPMVGLPEEVYKHGLSEAKTKKWLTILDKKGRIPYIQYPYLCARCGKLYPEMFNVPDEEWEKYIEPRMRNKVICRKCYDEIKRLIDKRKK
jgi:hypothetical protein